ncbi:MAG: histidine kinase [Lachnospiraceae bacterium]|nr:histidine kinase [Lachnospiraceae bacterium]
MKYRKIEDKIVKLSADNRDKLMYIGLILEIVAVILALYVFFKYDFLNTTDGILARDLAIEVVGCVVLLLLYLSIIGNHNFDKLNVVISRALVFSTYFILSDIINLFFEGNTSYIGLNYFVCYLYFLLPIMIMFYYSRYVFVWSNKSFDDKNLYLGITALLVLVGVAIIMLNIPTGYIFSISDEGYYTPGPYEYMCNVEVILCYIVVLVYIWRNIDRLSERLIFSSYALIPMVGAVLETINMNGSLLVCEIFLTVVFIYTNVFSSQNYMLAKREKESFQSEINSVSSQINPHFIYNTLGMIAGLCREKPEEAEQLIYDFSDYLRENVSNFELSKLNTVDVGIEHLEKYIKIEKTRFPEIDFIIDVEDGSFLIPPMSIQPLIENSIKHGIRKKPDGRGTIRIHAYSDSHNHILTVEDDGVGFDTEKPYSVDNHKHIGVDNVRFRLKRMCDGSLDIKSVPGEGTICIIKIPRRD